MAADAPRERAVGERPLRVVLLGWHGSKERQLRPLLRWYEGRGHDARIVLTPTFEVMARPGGWPRFGRALAEEIAAAHAKDPRPLLVHAFSNAGFWTLSAFLDATREHHPELCAAHVASVIDSAPGFPPRVRWWFGARYASMAMTPSVLERLGRRTGAVRGTATVRHFHPLVSPPLMLFMGAFHLLARRQVRFMESGGVRVREPHVGKPLLAIYSTADRLIPTRYVEEFLDEAQRAGVKVERLRLDDSAHVRHFLTHRHAYLEAVASLLGRVD